MGWLPLILGGGHEVAFGTGGGLLRVSNASLGVVNIDAHLDLRPTLSSTELPDEVSAGPAEEAPFGHSGSGFLQLIETAEAAGISLEYLCLGLQRAGNSAPLLDRATSLGARWVSAEDLEIRGGVESMTEVDTLLASSERIYLSVCLDAFSAASAPGVSAPQALGLNPWGVIPLIRRIAESGKLAAIDFAELCPRFDLDGRSARLLASLFFECLEGISRVDSAASVSKVQ